MATDTYMHTHIYAYTFMCVGCNTRLYEGSRHYATAAVIEDILLTRLQKAFEDDSGYEDEFTSL